MEALWKRSTWVTRGPDPTEVVQWAIEMSDGHTIKITEFQGIIGVVINREPVHNPPPYWTERFNQLESKWQEGRDDTADSNYFDGTMEGGRPEPPEPPQGK